MAIYRIFPDKDAFIYSEVPTANAGRDEIVEIGGYPGTIDGTGQASRIVTKFSDSEIDDVINNKITLDATGSMSASLKLYLAEANELPVEYTLYAYPIYIAGSGDWDNGTGKFGDTPVNRTGVNWTYKNAGQLNAWSTSNFATFTTGSFITGKEGGGNWYTASNGESMEFSQSHNMS
jgi:hypothetical protein